MERIRRPFSRRAATTTLRNSPDAYRHFLRPNFLSSTNEVVIASMRHNVTGGLIGLFFAFGFIGWSLTFWL